MKFIGVATTDSWHFRCRKVSGIRALLIRVLRRSRGSFNPDISTLVWDQERGWQSTLWDFTWNRIPLQSAGAFPSPLCFQTQPHSGHRTNRSSFPNAAHWGNEKQIALDAWRAVVRREPRYILSNSSRGTFMTSTLTAYLALRNLSALR